MRIFQTLWYLMLLIVLYYFERNLCEKPFLEPKVLSDFEESFVLNDLEYILTNRRITWEEAEIGCAAFESGSLAVIDNSEKAKFLALVLAETDLVVEDLWVGAVAEPCPSDCNETGDISKAVHCVEGKCFKWFTGDHVIGEFMLPRHNEAPLVERDCLSFSRNDHQQPTFVDLYCRLQRPYICQRPAKEEYGEMTHRGWIRIGNYEYAIFYAKITWKEAVRECFIKHKAHLADFRGLNEIAGIGKYLLTGRPSLENAWIGGHYKAGEWRYISIDDVIPRNTNPNTLYPPWPETNNYSLRAECLLLDRHLEDKRKLIFLPDRCHRRKSYICSRKIADDELSPNELIIIDDACYTIFYTPKTWDAANDTCNSRNSWLVEVTEDKIDSILYIMGENRTEINHIWIGGRLLSDNKWYWVNDHDPIESKQSIFTGYPPWIDEKFDQKYACLNMDRENHNKAIFYGVYCLERQPFVCQQYDTEKCISPTTTPNGNTDITPSTTTTPSTTITPTTIHDIWKWKWPTEVREYVQIKPFFNWTPSPPPY